MGQPKEQLAAFLKPASLDMVGLPGRQILHKVASTDLSGTSVLNAVGYRKPLAIAMGGMDTGLPDAPIPLSPLASEKMWRDALATGAIPHRPSRIPTETPGRDAVAETVFSPSDETDSTDSKPNKGKGKLTKSLAALTATLIFGGAGAAACDGPGAPSLTGEGMPPGFGSSIVKVVETVGDTEYAVAKGTGNAIDSFGWCIVVPAEDSVGAAIQTGQSGQVVYDNNKGAAVHEIHAAGNHMYRALRACERYTSTAPTQPPPPAKTSGPGGPGIADGEYACPDTGGNCAGEVEVDPSGNGTFKVVPEGQSTWSANNVKPGVATPIGNQEFTVTTQSGKVISVTVTGP